VKERKGSRCHSGGVAEFWRSLTHKSRGTASPSRCGNEDNPENITWAIVDIAEEIMESGRQTRPTTDMPSRTLPEGCNSLYIISAAWNTSLSRLADQSTTSLSQI
jgi:hypothetical protein